MSGRDDAVRELERRLRREAPPCGGLSEEARASLRERLARTAPEPGAPPAIGGRVAAVGAVALVAVVVGAVVVTRQNPGAGDDRTPAIVERYPDTGVLGPAFVDGVRDRIGRLASGVTGEAPMLEEMRRIAMDLRALRGALAERASALDLRARRTDG